MSINQASTKGKAPSKSILQKPHDYEEHETPVHKIQWDENCLKNNERQQKNQVLMHIDEPNTPYIRYDATTNKVTNWQDIPESVREASDEPDLFRLDSTSSAKSTPKVDFPDEPEEWEQIDENEEKARKEAEQKRHAEFEAKRAKHYYHEGTLAKNNE